MNTGNRLSKWPATPPVVRLLSKLIRDDKGCWIWTAATNPAGYGKISICGTMVHSHRALFEILVGPIPEGFELDHLCKVTLCANPLHLEAVTARVNNLRSDSIAAKHARKTHCKRGHEFTPENTCRRSSNPLWRDCRTCRREKMRQLRRLKGSVA